MRILTLFLVLAILLTACGGGGEAPTTTTDSPTPLPTSLPTVLPTTAPTQATEPVAQAAESPSQTTEAPAIPTESPSQATEAPAIPTEAPLPTTPPEPTDAPAPTDTLEPPSTPVAEGRVSFRDNLAVGDQLVLTMRGLAPPPDGFVYEGWLIAGDGVTEISTGVFQAGAEGGVDHTWVSPAGENLLAQYASFAVTVEPADDGDPGPSSEVVFRGAADSSTLAAARRVFATNDGEPATPRNVSYGQGLLTQSQVAKDHALNAFNAAAIGAFAEMRVHCEHLINIIEGTSGSRFADYTGDGRAENPGDGFGTLVYARQMAALLPGTGDELSAVEGLLIAIQDQAQKALDAPDIATAQPLVSELKTMGERLLNETAPAFYAAAQAAVSFPIAPSP